MDRRTFLKAVPAFTVLTASTRGFTQETPTAPKPGQDTKAAEPRSPNQDGGGAPSTGPGLEPIVLPKPQMDGG